MTLVKGLTYALVLGGGIVIGAIGMNYRLNAKMSNMPAMVKSVDGACMYMDNVSTNSYKCESVNEGMTIISDKEFIKGMKTLTSLVDMIIKPMPKNENPDLEKGIEALQKFKE